MKIVQLLLIVSTLFTLASPSAAAVILTWGGPGAPGGETNVGIGSTPALDSFPFDPSFNASRSASSALLDSPYAVSASGVLETLQSGNSFSSDFTGFAEQSGNAVGIGLSASYQSSYLLFIEATEPMIMSYTIVGDTATSQGSIDYILNSLPLYGTGNMIINGYNSLSFGVYGFVSNGVFGDGPPSSEATFSGISLSFAPVPEPSTAVLFIGGVALAAALCRRKK